MTAVTITRRRHPLEGHTLRVLGRMRRHGTDELLLELPDGSKSLVPAAWTDLTADAGETDATATVGTVGDLLAAVAVVATLLARISGDEGQAAQQSPCKEDHRAAHPAQFATRPGASATTASAHRAFPVPGRDRDRAAGRPDRQDRRDNSDHHGDDRERGEPR